MSFIYFEVLISLYLMKMRVREIFCFFVIVSLVILVFGYGMLIDFVSRNFVWRFFLNCFVQYIDNELNCGGFSVQWSMNKGKCGVCGDVYYFKNLRYVYLGEYVKDCFIMKIYNEGQEIEVKVKIILNY